MASHWPAPVHRWMKPLNRFLHVESAGGVVLLIGTLAALALANSPLAGAWSAFWQTRIGLDLGDWQLTKPLVLWVNDGLMTLFFFVVGLEIKREIVAGELRDRKKAALPVMAAAGGMIVPAAIYLLLRGGRPGENGWGIPMATDIAFVVGVLSLLGRRVPLGLKVMLLSLAIADDIGAVLVIALFYSGEISLLALGLAAVGFVTVVLFSRIGVRNTSVYVLVGLAIWLAFLKAGIHPTVAGVLLGLLTPARAGLGERPLVETAERVLSQLRETGDDRGENNGKQLLGQLERAAREGVSPLERLESRLHPWVAFVIMPLFALANAGVRIRPAALTEPVAIAVALGLVIGKPAGILLFSWLAVRLRLARLPDGVNWKMMIGAGCLAGIGFTMSLFIAGLALEPALLDAGKIGTLTGSAVSAVLGCLLLVKFLRSTVSSSPAHGVVVLDNKKTAEVADVD